MSTKRTSAKTPAEQSEICGIIISRGARDEVPPRFAAYIWGPVPVADEDVTSRAA